MQWTQSGIAHSWDFQLVDSVNLSDGRGWLSGVTGGKLTESYRGDTRSMVTLDLDGATIPLGTAVRVWHTATYNGETERECLGTFHPEPYSYDYDMGRSHGSITCYSSLKKLSSTLSGNVRGVGKVNVINWFKTIAVWAMCVPWVQPSWKTSATFSSSYVWDMTAENFLTEAQRCADAVGGYLGVDEQGRVTLTPYIAPSDMPSTWTLDGLALVGVKVDTPDIVNRVVAKYEKDGKTYKAVKDADSTHPWAKAKIGRIEAVSINPSTIEDGANIQQTLDKLVADELKSKTSTTTDYSVDAMYSALIKCGTVGTFVYQDSLDNEGIMAKVLCSGREIALDYTAQMALTLEEI